MHTASLQLCTLLPLSLSATVDVCTATDWAHPATSAPGPTGRTPAIANAEDAKARAEREAKEEKEYRDLEVEKILSQVGRTTCHG